MFDLSKFKVYGVNADVVGLTTDIAEGDEKKLKIETTKKVQKKKNKKETSYITEERNEMMDALIDRINEHEVDKEGNELRSFKMNHEEVVESVIDFITSVYIYEKKIVNC